jgi:hypothetical protein
MPNYNLTNVTNAENYYQVFEAVSVWHNNAFPIFFLACIYFITLIILRDYDIKDSILISGFIVSISSIIFRFLGVIGWGIMIVPIVLFIGSLFIRMFWSN